MNEIQIFTNELFGSVRTLEQNDGKVLFCGSDAAKALGYKKPNDAISVHCRCTMKYSIPHPQSDNKTIEMLFITEGDMYRLITHSKLPDAEKFEEWVFDEILPTIHKHGSYSTQQQLSPMEMIAAMATNAVEMERRLKEAENKVAETSSKLEQALDVFANDTLAITDWAGYINGKIMTVCKQNHLSSQSEKGRLYKELEATARCNLTKRVTEKQKRMKKAGAKYADWKNVAKLDVISDDPKLRVIFDGIVKKFEAKYIQGDNVQMGLLET